MKTTPRRPLVLIGPSGAGKSTVAERLSILPSVEIISTVTTRPVRPQEDIYTHTFVNQTIFDAMRAQGKFIGTTHFFGYDYGLPKLPDTKGQAVLLLRAPFVKLFQTAYPDSLVVQLEAPLSILRQRLIARGNQDRADAEALEQEITLGHTVADLVISTDQPIEAYLDTIIENLTSGQARSS